MSANRYGRLVLGCLVPPALAAVSWLMGGDTVWLCGTVLSAAAILVLVVAASLKPLEQARTRDWLVLGWLGVGWAAWAGVGYLFPLTTVTIKPEPKEPEGPTRITYAGRVVAEPETVRECSFRLRGRFELGQLTIKTLAPQGWELRTFRTHDSDVSLDSVSTTGLYIDNRGHGSTRLECGKVELAIAAGAAERHAVLAPPLGAPAAVRIDGKTVGTLGDRPVLIDVLGTRTYRLRELTYGSGVLQAMWAVQGVQGQLPDPGPPDSVYESKHVHPLPGEIDYFLEAAPEKIEVTTFGAPVLQETRRELREVE
jgi:hypothetical protein